MAIISDYDTLVAEVKAWAARTDPAFSNRVETFVGFAEHRIYHGQGDPGDALYCQPLRAKELETDWAVTFTDGVGDVPGDMTSLRLIRQANSEDDLSYMTPKQFWERDAAEDSSGVPRYYTVFQQKIYVTPIYTGDLQLSYYKKFDAITSDNKTGTLLTAYPLLYLSGCLFEAFSFLQEEALAAGHWARYRSQVAAVNQMADAVRFGGGPKRVRVRNALP